MVRVQLIRRADMFLPAMASKQKERSRANTLTEYRSGGLGAKHRW